MKPTAEQIRMTRYLLLIIVRGVGAFLLLWGAIAFIYLILQATFDGQPGPGAMMGIAVALPGLGLTIFGNRIVQWLVPVPDEGCPGCGYNLREIASERCPECGLTIAEDIDTKGDAAP